MIGLRPPSLCARFSSSRAGFGSTKRSETGPPDSAHCFHGKVPVDMTNNSTPNVSPGPQYWPSMEATKAASKQPVFGTSKRVTKNQAIVMIAEGR